MSSLVRSSYLICPICSSHLCDHRALRNHLQSSCHAIVRKSELDSLVEAARNGEGEAIYQGDLAKGGRDKGGRDKNNRDIPQTPAEEPTIVATVVEVRDNTSPAATSETSWTRVGPWYVHVGVLAIALTLHTVHTVSCSSTVKMLAFASARIPTAT